MSVERNLLLATIATVLVTALLAVVFMREDARMDRAAESRQGTIIARGANLYDAYCAGCHGRRGEGLTDIYPPLNVEDLWGGREDILFYGTLHDYISLNISAGHPTLKMPSWADEYGGPLRNDQVEDLTQFLLNWMGPQPEGVRPEVEVVPTPTAVIEPTPVGTPAPVAEGDPLRGEEIYAQNCAVCHGPDASGSSLGRTLISADLAARDDDYFRDAIASGRPGTSMPAYGDLLSLQDIEDIIAFLRSKQ